jgi:hypothetical protein
MRLTNNRDLAIYMAYFANQGAQGEFDGGMITNGGFENSDYWVENGTWSISDGKLTGGGALDFSYTNYDDNNDGGTANIFTAGNTYRLTADVVRNSGTLEFRYLTTTIGAQITSTGAISVDFTPSADSYLRIYNAFSFDGTVDNVRVVDITPPATAYMEDSEGNRVKDSEGNDIIIP